MDSTNPEEAILAQARTELDRWSAGDLTGYGGSAAADVTYFDNIGAHSLVDGYQALQDYLAALQGQVPAHNYELIDPKVQVYGDVGVLTLGYRAFLGDGETIARGKGTSVYRRTDGAWQLVHAHWSTADV